MRRRYSYRRDVNPDTTPIKEAFAELRKLGYVARMNFSCCGSCGWYDIGQSKKGSDKAVFYHRQANERLTRTGRCDLQWSGDAKQICAVLEKHGVTVTCVPLDDTHTIEIDLTGEFEKEAAQRAASETAWATSAHLAW